MALSSKHPVVRTFLRGVGLLLPIALTAALLIWLWQQLSERLVGHVIAGVDRIVSALGFEPLSRTRRLGVVGRGLAHRHLSGGLLVLGLHRPAPVRAA